MLQGSGLSENVPESAKLRPGSFYSAGHFLRSIILESEQAPYDRQTFFVDTLSWETRSSCW